MQPIKTLYKYPDLDTIVLIAGDGDFHDMVEFMMKTLNKKVVLFGWKASMNKDLFKMCT